MAFVFSRFHRLVLAMPLAVGEPASFQLTVTGDYSPLALSANRWDRSNSQTHLSTATKTCKQTISWLLSWGSLGPKMTKTRVLQGSDNIKILMWYLFWKHILSNSTKTSKLGQLILHTVLICWYLLFKDLFWRLEEMAALSSSPPNPHPNPCCSTIFRQTGKKGR